MGRFRKKPVVINAIQYADPEGILELAQDRIADFMEANITIAGDQIEIETLEGIMYASPGDWIIKGIKGELYPVRADIFAETYEPAD